LFSALPRRFRPRQPASPVAPAQQQPPVPSAGSALVLSGEFDPIASHYGDRGVGTLANAYVDTPRGESHGASLSDCGVELVWLFWWRPNVRRDTLCGVELPALA
jgi:hypothetical protein